MSNVDRLKEILSRSKAVMKKTDEEYGGVQTKGGSSSYSMEEKEIPNLTENFIKKHQGNTTKSVAPVNGRYRNMEKSKMPQFIKEAMINNPIDIPETPFHTFELEDMSDLLTQDNEYTQPETYQEKLTPSKQKIGTVASIDENMIRKMVREEIESVVRTVVNEYFDKSLVTDDIQIKVGKTIYSGKLKPLPNKR
jgi:hypothetical protein